MCVQDVSPEAFQFKSASLLPRLISHFESFVLMHHDIEKTRGGCSKGRICQCFFLLRGPI